MDWDDFTFDYELNTDGILSDVITIEAHRQSAQNLILPPDWRNQLDQLNRVRAVHGTTALEGNPLSEAEVSRQIEIAEQPFETSGLRATKEQQQIRNAGLAQEWIRTRFVPGRAPLNVEDILRMHKMLTESSDEFHNSPGKFRNFSVVVGSPDLGGVHRGGPHGDVPRLIDEYVEFINSRAVKNLHPVIRALMAHFFLVAIHPFGDGNGRVSRLVEAGILFQGGYNIFGFYGLSNYFYRNETEYKTTLQECRQSQPFDVTSFVKFGLRGFSEELRGINNFIKAKLNRVVYRAMLVRAFNTKVGERRRALNQREYNLLDYLIVQTEPLDPFSENPSRQIKFSELRESPYVNQAYRNVTDRTFWRELMRLSEMSFIKFIRTEDGWGDPLVELDFSAIGNY
ncbi:MAG: Fic family protein [Rhodobacteraceae bacterium]|nr:Fic family protein [Paracoccaceae bacterium]